MMMKKLLLFTASILMISNLAFSRGYRNMSAEEIAKRDIEQLKSELDLTADQEKKAYDISLKNAEKMKETFESSAGDREAMRSTMQLLRKERDDAFREFLTDEQFKGYQKIQQERIQQRRQRQGGGGGRNQ